MGTAKQQQPKPAAKAPAGARPARAEVARGNELLTRPAGNRAVARLLSPPAPPREDEPRPGPQPKAVGAAGGVQRPAAPTRIIQTKLRVSAPGDEAEAEAERVADEVMRMPAPGAAREARVAAGAQVQMKPGGGARGGDGGVAEATVGEAVRGGGRALEGVTREFMEGRFGRDFGHVRVHTDAAAAASAKALNALAYTVGGDIVFGANQYAPHTTAGKRLLAHEITHVVQQSRPAAASSARAAAPARSSNRGGSLNVSSVGKTAISRFPSPVSFGVNKPGLSFMPPIIKEGYDGQTYTAIKSDWGNDSWERHWMIFDADDKLLYESYYTWPQPTLYIPKDVVAKGRAAGNKTPWSVWHEVTQTLVPFGGSDKENFPYAYMKFYVYETWKEFMADPQAKLSNVKQQEGGTQPAKPTPLDSKIVKGAESVIDYGSAVAMHEAYLRKIYDSGAKGITETAQELVTKGLPQRDAAKWANEARNMLKLKIREDGNAILKQVFETRNLGKYGNKLGPTYEQLFQKYSKQGLAPEEINKKIIGSAGRANVKVNRWGGRLRVAGRIMLAIDIALAGVRVYLAPEGEKVKTAIEEAARIGGALVMGAAGAEAGAAAGAAVGALFGGVGAAPGAVIGGIIGGIGGAIFGGWLGQTAVEKVYEMFPPSDCVFEGEFKEEDR